MWLSGNPRVRTTERLAGPPLPLLLVERSSGCAELCDRCVVGEEIDVDAPHEVITVHSPTRPTPTLYGSGTLPSVSWQMSTLATVAASPSAIPPARGTGALVTSPTAKTLGIWWRKWLGQRDLFCPGPDRSDTTTSGAQ